MWTFVKVNYAHQTEVLARRLRAASSMKQEQTFHLNAKKKGHSSTRANTRVRKRAYETWVHGALVEEL
ncbi:hypothetical protein HZH66_003402 [Vespula vulgaris]|uniref:Uncharacterized protein n=1 Tax=Vespula vulgaris TaxID=7454 RepID=A0A834KCZ9_VESVU|nr:hypothetical protein HZH66_003402 [Vespula vulgaris]